MRRVAWLWSAIVTATCAALATAAPPLVDRPTPPPCAADGRCYPNYNEWGYYPGRWRRWPGHELVPVPAEPTPADRLGPDLSPYELPTPEEEDAQAPPASTKPEEAAPAATPETDGTAPVDTAPAATPTLSPSTPDGGRSTPSLDPSSPDFDLPPSFESSPLDGPASPTSDLDPPPSPSFLQAGLRQNAAAISTPVPTAARPTARTAPGSDSPPPLPWAYRSAAL